MNKIQKTIKTISGNPFFKSMKQLHSENNNAFISDEDYENIKNGLLGKMEIVSQQQAYEFLSQTLAKCESIVSFIRTLHIIYRLQMDIGNNFLLHFQFEKLQKEKIANKKLNKQQHYQINYLLMLMNYMNKSYKALKIMDMVFGQNKVSIEQKFTQLQLVQFSQDIQYINKAIYQYWSDLKSMQNQVLEACQSEILIDSLSEQIVIQQQQIIQFIQPIILQMGENILQTKSKDVCQVLYMAYESYIITEKLIQGVSKNFQKFKFQYLKMEIKYLNINKEFNQDIEHYAKILIKDQQINIDKNIFKRTSISFQSYLDQIQDFAQK